MRLVFAGTPDAAVPSLRLLAASGHDVVAVVTRADKPVGRRRTITASPVATAAAELGIPVVKADRLDAEATAAVSAFAPDLGVIVAYGGLVREPLLSAPRHGWINLHFSLLPAWRGAAPVQHALIAGDEVTGASVFQLVPALDAGPVFAESPMDVPPEATAGDLLAALAVSGADLVRSVVDGIADGTATSCAQDGEATLAPKLDAADGLLDFDLPAARVLSRFRGVTPEPGAHTVLDGARLKILDAAPADATTLAPRHLALVDGAVLVGTATTPVHLRTIQPAGKGPLDAAAWWRGLRQDHPVVGS